VAGEEQIVHVEPALLGAEGEGDAWLDAATRVVYNLLTAAAAAGVRPPFFKRGRPWRPRDLLPRLCSPDGVLAGLLRCAPPSFSSTGVAQSPIARAQVRHVVLLSRMEVFAGLDPSIAVLKPEWQAQPTCAPGSLGAPPTPTRRSAP
jgi:hypothetical protein